MLSDLLELWLHKSCETAELVFVSFSCLHQGEILQTMLQKGSKVGEEWKMNGMYYQSIHKLVYTLCLEQHVDTAFYVGKS